MHSSVYLLACKKVLHIVFKPGITTVLAVKQKLLSYIPSNFRKKCV